MTKSRGLREHHGMSKTSVYIRWVSMRNRCNNTADTAYPNYGGRGIRICPAWNTFSVFYADMGDPPPGASLERKDNNGPYSPENCCWATRTEQSRNRRNNVIISLDGETHPLSVWAERFGIRYATVHQRIYKYGWAIEAAIKTPLVHQRDRRRAENGVTFHGQAANAQDAA